MRKRLTLNISSTIPETTFAFSSSYDGDQDKQKPNRAKERTSATFFPRLTSKPRYFVPVSKDLIMPSFVFIEAKAASIIDEAALSRHCKASDS